MSGEIEQVLFHEILSRLDRIAAAVEKQIPGARFEGIPYAKTPGGITTVNAVSSKVLGLNDDRQYATFVNAGNVDAYLLLGVWGAIGGIYLKRGGGAAVIGKRTDIPHTGEVYGITQAGTTTITFTES